MDIVRLAIVYDTSEAGAKLLELDRRLAGLTKSSTGANTSARGVEGALRSLAVSATGVPGPIGKLSTALAGLTVSANVIIPVLAAVAIGYYLLIKRSQDLRAENDKLAKSFADVAGAGAAFAFIESQRQLTEAQDKYNKMRQQAAFIDRQQGGVAGRALKFIMGLTDADIQDQASKVATLVNLTNAYRGAWQDAHDKIITGHNREIEALTKIGELARANAAQQRAAAEFIAERERIQQELFLLTAPPGLVFPTGQVHDLGTLERPIEGTVKALEIAGIRFEDLGNASIGLKRDFDLAGKSVLDFVGALAQVIGVLFPNDPGLGYAVLGIGQAIIGGRSGGTGGGREVKPIKPNVASEPSMATNVNFNVVTNDAQGVAQWAERHGPVIAAEIVRQADRSRALRRRFWRQ